MKYYLYVMDNDTRIRCGEEIAQLNEDDLVRKDDVLFRVEYKCIDYDDNLFDVNVHIDE